jgi:hypothetical protein
MIEQRAQLRFRVTQRILGQLVLGNVSRKPTMRLSGLPASRTGKPQTRSQRRSRSATQDGQNDGKTPTFGLQLADRLDQRAPVVGFEDVEQQRWRRTIEAIEHRLVDPRAV